MKKNIKKTNIEKDIKAILLAREGQIASHPKTTFPKLNSQSFKTKSSLTCNNLGKSSTRRKKKKDNTLTKSRKEN